ncbi:PREDICTED: zinc finger protein 414 [Nanorana parkeri]|uniref:zinc finger protein 414 n=1 Tax=Nanorana parkeri TaxID=125878 RepID=UPI000854DFD2|nr:PREDICTED: zinc finger protein 414 [Nanorana parkeri]
MDKQEDTPADTRSKAKNEDAGPSTSQTVRGVKIESKRPREGGKRRNLQGSKRGHRCATYGCNRSFLSMQELINHVSVHYKPTESMQDKKFICSMNDCGESLDSMQELMTHLKVHYKPNRYFKCENCMLPFRTHRSLFKHLHVCSDNPSRSVSDSITHLPPTADSKPAPAMATVSRHTSVIQCIKKDTELLAEEDPTKSIEAASASSVIGGRLPSVSKLASETSNSFPALSPSLYTSRLPGPQRSSVSGSCLSYLHQSPYSLPQGAVSQKLRPFLGNQGLPVSNAMWKKNQGQTSNSRIVWEHTRGSYKCMQCSFSTATRNQINKHIEEVHKNPAPSRPREDIGFDMDLLPFHSKLPGEMEPSLLPQV